jgi:hypothetical protein
MLGDFCPKPSIPPLHTEPLLAIVPPSVLSPNVSVLGEFCPIPFVRAVTGVSQILSKVSCKDELILSVGDICEWFLQSVQECSVDYADALRLTMKLDWHTHASRLGVNLSSPNLTYLMPSFTEDPNLFSNKSSEDDCDSLSDELNLNIPLEDFNGHKLSEKFSSDFPLEQSELPEDMNFIISLSISDTSNVGLQDSQNLMHNSMMETVLSE